MEPEGSLPCTQGACTSLCTELDESSPLIPTSFP